MADLTLICERCGSPDLREVERPARSRETTGGDRPEWRCIDCGTIQGAEPDAVSYDIVRFHQNGNWETIVRGLTLAQAQAHCQRDDTHGPGWFDGYRDGS